MEHTYSLRILRAVLQWQCSNPCECCDAANALIDALRLFCDADDAELHLQACEAFK